MSTREASVRKKQWVIAGSLLGGVMVVALGAAYVLTDSKGPPPPPKAPAVTVMNSAVRSNDKENWRANQSAEMEKMARALQDLQAQQAKDLADRQQKEKADKEALARQELAPPAPPALDNRPLPIVMSPPKAGPFRTVGTTPAPPVSPLVDPEPPQPASKVKSVNFTDEVGSATPGSNVLVQGAQQFAKSAAAPVPTPTPATVDPQKQVNAETYVPAGTYVRAVLLNGVDAPTGGQAQQNPAPALLRLVDDGALPNAFRGRLRDCKVTINGYGELSSERALMRTDRLSCILVDGSAIDMAVKGYVAGEDGKTGVRGKVVSKTGQALSNAIWAAGLSAIGAGIAGATSTQSTNALGTTTTTTDNPGAAAFGQGTQKAFDRLAQYYINLADKLFPVIEVDGGRVVEVVFTSGFSMVTSPTVSAGN